MTFELLGVKPEMVKTLREHGITSPTLIQRKAIPIIKSGKDIIGVSKTGSGKTAAFGVPLLEKIVPGNGIQVLVIAPTRELAVQISGELKKFGKNMNCSIAMVFGGVAIGPQIHAMADADIVVGTPGRLVDHLERTTLNLSHLTSVVLDEADKMVEMGFIEDIRKIMDQTPKNRQVLLFGATISEEINDLKREYMKEPPVAKTEAHVEEEFLEQYYYDVQPHEKFSLLVHLLRKENAKRVIIFCSKRSTVQLVARNLDLQGIKADMIHGKLSQNTRLRTMERFHREKNHVLVASAVAARGLDIKDVTHIFNYDLPQDPQEYIHRIGRTARAGESGKAITLLSSNDYESFSCIQDRYPVNVEKLPREEFAKLRFDAGRRYDRFRGQGGFRRPSGFRGQGEFRGHGESRGQSGFRNQRRYNSPSDSGSPNSPHGHRPYNPHSQDRPHNPYSQSGPNRSYSSNRPHSQNRPYNQNRQHSRPYNRPQHRR